MTCKPNTDGITSRPWPFTVSSNAALSSVISAPRPDKHLARRGDSVHAGFSRLSLLVRAYRASCVRVGLKQPARSTLGQMVWLKVTVV